MRHQWDCHPRGILRLRVIPRASAFRCLRPALRRALRLASVLSSVPRAGEKVGLVGRNGSGKSTLLKLLNRDMRPDSGQIDIPGSYKIGYLAQTITFDEGQTPREVCNSAFSEIQNIESELAKVQADLEASNDHDEQMELAGKLSALVESWINEANH